MDANVRTISVILVGLIAFLARPNLPNEGSNGLLWKFYLHGRLTH